VYVNSKFIYEKYNSEWNTVLLLHTEQFCHNSARVHRAVTCNKGLSLLNNFSKTVQVTDTPEKWQRITKLLMKDGIFLITMGLYCFPFMKG
jgi:hypothetical protein